MKVCCYKYFSRKIQKKPEVFVSGEEKYQTGKNPALCFHSVKAKEFFSILFFKQNEKKNMHLLYKLNIIKLNSLRAKEPSHINLLTPVPF